MLMVWHVWHCGVRGNVLLTGENVRHPAFEYLGTSRAIRRMTVLSTKNSDDILRNLLVSFTNTDEPVLAYRGNFAIQISAK